MVDDSNGDPRSENMVRQLRVGMILCRPFQLHDPGSEEEKDWPNRTTTRS